LEALRTRGEDPVDGGTKAHVERPVGLVEEQHPDPVERVRAAGEQVLEPARVATSKCELAASLACLTGPWRRRPP
jgi:hypothetical protein